MTTKYGPTVPLAPIAAKELGRVLEGWRTGQRMSLDEVQRAGGPVDAYTSQIEQGRKLNVSEEMFRRQSHAIRLSEETLADLLLRARVKSALLWRGLPVPLVDMMWTCLARCIEEGGHRVQTDFAEQLARLMLDEGRPKRRRRGGMAR